MGTGCTARKESPESSDMQPRHSTRLATGLPRVYICLFLLLLSNCTLQCVNWLMEKTTNLCQRLPTNASEYSVAIHISTSACSTRATATLDIECTSLVVCCLQMNLVNQHTYDFSMSLTLIRLQALRAAAWSIADV
jgi:hypothetical protein